MSDQPLQLALLGAGWVAERAYAPVLRAAPFKVVCVYDPAAERARRLAALLPGSQVVSDASACLASAARAAIVCAPAHEHAGLIDAWLRSGRHVLCEKPVLRSALACQQLTAAERLMGSATMRLRADVARFLRWTRETSDPVVQLRLRWLRHRGVPGLGSWRTDPSLSPWGVLEDLGPHLIDIALGVLPLPAATRCTHSELRCRDGDKAHTMGGWLPGAPAQPYTVPDYCRSTLLTPSGCRVQLELAWTDEIPGDLVTLEATTARGAVGFEGLLGYSDQRRLQQQRVWRSGQFGREIVEFTPGPPLQADAFAALLERFRQFCAGEAEPLACAAEVETVARVMEQLVAAAGLQAGRAA